MPDRLRELSRPECLDRLAHASIGRVGCTSRALPAIVPVNFVLSGSTVVFRTERDGMLARACASSVVAFEVDELATDGSHGWSVLVVGVGELLDGSAAVRAAAGRLVCAPGDGRDQFVGITIGTVTGREVAPAMAVR